MHCPSQTEDHLEREPTASTWFVAKLEVMPSFPRLCCSLSNDLGHSRGGAGNEGVIYSICSFLFG